MSTEHESLFVNSMTSTRDTGNNVWRQQTTHGMSGNIMENPIGIKKHIYENIRFSMSFVVLRWIGTRKSLSPIRRGTTVSQPYPFTVSAANFLIRESL